MRPSFLPVVSSVALVVLALHLPHDRSSTHRSLPVVLEVVHGQLEQEVAEVVQDGCKLPDMQMEPTLVGCLVDALPATSL